MGINDNTLNEIDRERVSYLLNIDDLNYAMLEGHTIIGKSSYLTDMSNDGLEKIKLVKNLVSRDVNTDPETLMDTQSQIEFPKRKYQVRPATMEDEIAGDSSYSD